MSPMNAVTSFTLETETFPGPSTYAPAVNSCLLAPHRKIGFTRAKRFMETNRPSALPTASMYDTRPHIRLVMKEYAKVGFARATRDISPSPTK